MSRLVYVDFNTAGQDESGRVIIPSWEVGDEFNNGLQIVLKDEEIEVRATLEFDNEMSRWLALPDYSTIRYLDNPNDRGSAT